MLATRPQPAAVREEKIARDARAPRDFGRALARTKIAAARRLVAFTRDEDGGPLVEFTILIPMIFLVLFGIVDWGNVYFIRNDMFVAARLAAREAAVGAITSSSGVGQGAVAVACGTSTIPGVQTSPIAGTGYTYTFTFDYNQGCTGVSNPSNPTWGTVTMTISTPGATVATFNYQKLIGATLQASATVEQEYTCPAAHPSSPYTATQKC